MDPLRFGIMPITASGTDPEQLASLLGAEQALADAGVFEKGTPLQNCSFIIGRGSFSGLIQMRSINIIRTALQVVELLRHTLPELTEADLERVKTAYQAQQGRYQPDMATGSMPNLIASLVANRFDMHGPAYIIDAACASGIVAINHSITLIRSGQCDMAVAGAMHAGQSPMFWGVFDMIGALSHKQVIAPFSEDADGLLCGQGGGFVVLKTLRRAIEDGDRIYAVIKETSICSDGASAHVMVTSVDGQTRLLEQTWKMAGMDPEKIGYVEAHGTGTIAGDRTELATLKRFFGDNTHPPAYVGSVKSNIGHPMPAAGIIGVIKTALALYWRKIPPTLHCERPQAAMFESRFLPPQELIDWDGEKLPLVAGVNSFGFGGVNAHAIMTAYEPEPGAPCQKRRPYYGAAYMVSAKNGPALIEKLKKGDFTDTGGDYRIAMLDTRETRISQAVAIVEADAPCRGRMDIWFTNKPMLSGGGKIVFMFPGYWDEWLTETDSLSEALDLPRNGVRPAEAAESPFGIVKYVYNTKRLCIDALEKLGVKADVYAGYSVGEWDAARLAGVIECGFDDWAAALSDWDSTKTYPMAVVNGVDRRTAEAWCAEIPGLFLQCENSAGQVMMIGGEPAMEVLVNILKEKNIYHTVIHRTPFHTPLAAGMTPERGVLPFDLEIREGSVPVWSAVSLEPVPTGREEYLQFQVDELTKPVYFRQLIEKLYDEQNARVFIQIGLGPLAAFAEDTLQGRDFGAASTCSNPRACADQLRRVLALLFAEGLKVDHKFAGVNPGYLVDHNLMIVPNAAPPLIREFPELDEAVRKRYGELEPGGGFAAAPARGYANPVAAAADENIRHAIAVQRELAKFFAQIPSAAVSAAPSGPAVPVAGEQKRPPAKREQFTEIIHMTLEDHPYLLDHAIVRQPKDWPFPEDLNPIVPFTMTIELLAEIAMKRAPGRKLVKVGNMSAYKWIGVEKPLDLTVKGKWIGPDTLSMEIVEYAQAEYTFGDGWAEPPEKYKGDIDVGREIMERTTPEKLYRLVSFHGPLYQSLIRQDRVCERGMVCTAVKMPGKGSLLDIMGQQLGLFLHLTQTDNTVSFPVRMRELEFYSDIFDQDGTFESTALITRLTETMVSGDVILKRGGKIWCVSRDFVAQRFHSTPLLWNAILKPQRYMLSDEITPGVYHYRCDSPENVVALLAIRYLNTRDRAGYDSLETPRRRREYLIGRIALKDAARARLTDENGDMPYPIEFCVVHDDNGRPRLEGIGRLEGKAEAICVSLSHKNNDAAAIVSDKPVGIDLEKIEAKPDDFINEAFTQSEIELLKKTGDPEDVIRFWVAKEAVAKMAGEGLRGDSRRFEVSAAKDGVLTVGETRVKTVKIGADLILGWTI